MISAIQTEVITKYVAQMTHYNYNYAKVKVINMVMWHDEETKINEALKEIQDNGGIVDKVDNLLIDNEHMRTIIVYRVAAV